MHLPSILISMGLDDRLWEENGKDNDDGGSDGGGGNDDDDDDDDDDEGISTSILAAQSEELSRRRRQRRPHLSRLTHAGIAELGSELLEQPTDNSVLDPSDYYLFGSLKKYLGS
ncbi:hypothetical protein Trydic_g15844 [Trypoxylus dichotomus]